MKRMRPYTLGQFMDEFPLIPYIVGQTVANEFGMAGLAQEEFARYTESRMIAVFNHNQNFRRKMTGPDSREWLYAFARHWCAAWQNERQRMRMKGHIVDIDELFEEG